MDPNWFKLFFVFSITCNFCLAAFFKKSIYFWILTFVLYSFCIFFYDYAFYESDLTEYTDLDFMSSQIAATNESLFYTPLIALSSFLPGKFVLLIYQSICLVAVYISDYLQYLRLKSLNCPINTLSIIPFLFFTLAAPQLLFNQIRFCLFFSLLLLIISIFLALRSPLLAYKSILLFSSFLLLFVHANAFFGFASILFVVILFNLTIRFSWKLNLRLLRKKILGFPIYFSLISISLITFPLYSSIFFDIFAPWIANLSSPILHLSTSSIFLSLDLRSDNVFSLFWLLSLLVANFMIATKSSFHPFLSNHSSSILLAAYFSIPFAFLPFTSRIFYSLSFLIVLLCFPYAVTSSLLKRSFFSFLLLIAILRFDSFFVLVS